MWVAGYKYFGQPAHQSVYEECMMFWESRKNDEEKFAAGCKEKLVFLYFVMAAQASCIGWNTFVLAST